MKREEMLDLIDEIISDNSHLKIANMSIDRVNQHVSGALIIFVQK